MGVKKPGQEKLFVVWTRSLRAQAWVCKEVCHILQSTLFFPLLQQACLNKGKLPDIGVLRHLLCEFMVWVVLC